MTRPKWIVPVLLAALLANGCMALRVVKTAKKVVTEDTEISLTVKGDQSRLDSLELDLRGFDVQAHVDAVETGITIVKLVGTYVAVMKSLDWIIARGLTVLANDENAELLLNLAFAIAKSA